MLCGAVELPDAAAAAGVRGGRGLRVADGRGQDHLAGDREGQEHLAAAVILAAVHLGRIEDESTETPVKQSLLCQSSSDPKCNCVPYPDEEGPMQGR